MENWDAGRSKDIPKGVKMSSGKKKAVRKQQYLRTNLLWSIGGRKETLLRVKQQQKVIHFKSERKKSPAHGKQRAQT